MQRDKGLVRPQLMNKMNPSDAKLQFSAEIKQVSSRKLASLDIEYKVVLLSPDPSILGLGALDAETMVKVTVEA